jgi:hypothetical protein
MRRLARSSVTRLLKVSRNKVYATVISVVRTLGLDACFMGSYDIPQAERHELGVALDVGHQVEHFISAVIYPLLRLESRHLLPSPDDLAAQWRGEMAVVRE